MAAGEDFESLLRLLCGEMANAMSNVPQSCASECSLGDGYVKQGQSSRGVVRVVCLPCDLT